MKCQKCDKVATFHITEMTDAQPEELHLCDEHAYEYLHKNDAKKADEDDEHSRGCACGSECSRDDACECDCDCENSSDADEENDASLKELTEDLMETDFQSCPCCGLGFQEFRKTGRLGCANDYRAFQDRLDPFLLSVHGASEHVGKTPRRRGIVVDYGPTLVRLRNELVDAVATEDYERASILRDKIKELTLKTA
ncbi:MAG: UvrB/UvrC motif-containing protein [Thermoguttaceae bacterium]|nr:UvrB/UvrC motif-containing protein [Thermoguttaceae bacterium]MBQ7110396.1 UvrB/UvrC motif-containing protein [Thermoguttaceae bacterium]